MKHLVVDSYVLHFPRTGVVNYVFHVLEELVRRSEIDLTVLVESNGFADPAVSAFAARSLKTRIVSPHEGSASGRSRRRQEKPLATRLPSPEEVSRAIMPGEIYHATDWYHYPARQARRNILTYHDLTAQLFPDTHEHTNIVKESRKLEAAVNFDHIVAVSQSTRADLITQGVKAERISVAYLAADPVYELASYYRRAEFLARYKLAADDRYILSVSTIERRKNTIGILSAFGVLKASPSFRRLKLVLSGLMGWKSDDLRAFLDTFPYRDDVIFTGYVPIEDMPSLYRHAEVFVYLSFYEGFGLPILEAMKSRCPVVCSNTSSMPEVLGDCGALVAPSDPEGAAGAVARILEDPVHADMLRFAALARSHQFSWARHVDHLVQIYDPA